LFSLRNEEIHEAYKRESLVGLLLLVYDSFMAIKVEFYGVARLRVGVAELSLPIAKGQGVALKQVLSSIAETLPPFGNDCLERGSLRREFTANLDGQRFIREPDQKIPDGSTLLILSTDAGG